MSDTPGSSYGSKGAYIHQDSPELPKDESSRSGEDKLSTYGIGPDTSGQSFDAFLLHKTNKPCNGIGVVVTLFRRSNGVACHSDKQYI